MLLEKKHVSKGKTAFFTAKSLLSHTQNNTMDVG